MRLGHGVLMLGTAIHLALVDLGIWIEPRLSSGDVKGRRIRPWLGLIVVALLVAGLVLVGEGVGYVVGSVLPHRERTP